jgi:hypothetical protein
MTELPRILKQQLDRRRALVTRRTRRSGGNGRFLAALLKAIAPARMCFTDPTRARDYIVDRAKVAIDCGANARDAPASVCHPSNWYRLDVIMLDRQEPRTLKTVM